MILSTRRLTKDAITDSIKENIPTRIAFKVPDRRCSKLILDRDGAEQLLEHGDLLYTDGGSLIRILGAFVDAPEVDTINEFISKQKGYQRPYVLPDPYKEDDSFDTYEVDMRHLDPLFEEVARTVVLTQQADTGMIQRRFLIGYNRVYRLMLQMEEAGIVSGILDARHREVLIHDEMSLEKIFSQYLDN